MSGASQPSDHPLEPIVGHVGLAEARRIVDALQALHVPAVARCQQIEAVDPETGATVELPAERVSDSGFGAVELFAVLVPAPYVEISLQVLDATTHRPLGPATEQEILADLEADSEPSGARPGGARRRRALAWLQIAVFAPIGIWILIQLVNMWSAVLRGR